MTEIQAMHRVRRWKWWPFAHKYVPAPRMDWSELVKLQGNRNETLRVIAAHRFGVDVERGK